MSNRRTLIFKRLARGYEMAKTKTAGDLREGVGEYAFGSVVSGPMK